MGSEKQEEVVDTLEDMLGLNEEIKKEAESQTKEEAQTPEVKEEPKKEAKEETPPKSTTQVVTPEQITIQKDIAKIDVQIEELEKATVSMDEFYANIENELSEKEQQLEFDDKSAYMKLINEKAREYETKNSNSEALETLTNEKKELEDIYAKQEAIVEVSAKHPEYNHEAMVKYFNEELSKSQQNKIFSASESYADVYENTYKQYIEANPANIQDVKAPNIPNVNNTRKQVPTNNDTDGNLMDEDERLKEALGL